MSIVPYLTSQEAMHIQTQSEKYSPPCHTQDNRTIGLGPIMHRETKILYSEHILLIVTVFTLKSSVTPTQKYRNTHALTHLKRS